MSGDGFGVTLEELSRIQKDWESLNQKMASLGRQLGQIKDTVAKAAATDLMASEFSGIVGFASVASQVAGDVDAVVEKAGQLQQTQAKLTQELGEDVRKVKQVAQAYEETERRVRERLPKHHQGGPVHHPKHQGGGPSHQGGGQGHGHHQGGQPGHPGNPGQPGHNPTPAPSNAGRIQTDQVTYDNMHGWRSGEAACKDYINEALDKMGITDPTARANWTKGMLTIASRESSYNAALINNWDTNAHGARQADGYPQDCSRGGWQTIPSTFAQYHQAGTSTDIYDPVANVASSMNYIMARYGVDKDGSNLASRVQQADPNRSPRGY